MNKTHYRLISSKYKIRLLDGKGKSVSEGKREREREREEKREIYL